MRRFARAVRYRGSGAVPAAGPRAVPAPVTTLVPRGNAWLVSGAGVTINGALAEASPATATSISVSSPGTTGVTKLLRNVLTAPIDLTGKFVGFWIKIPDMTHVSSISLFLGDSAWTNYVQINVTLSTTKNIHPDEWTLVTAPWAPVITTGTPNRAAIQQIRMDLKDDGAGVPVEWRFADQWATAPEPVSTFPTGAVSLTFDDSYALDLVSAKLAQYGMVGTLFPIGSAIGAAGKITAAQVTDWAASGWEVAAHASVQADHTSIDQQIQTDRLANLARAKAWVRGQGSSSDAYAYPNNSSSAAAGADVLTTFSVGRGGSNDIESLPPCRPDYLRAYQSGPSATVSTTLKLQTDRALAARAWAIFTFHSFVTTAPGSLDTLVSEFNTFIDYLATQPVEVLTVGSVLSRLSGG